MNVLGRPGVFNSQRLMLLCLWTTTEFFSIPRRWAKLWTCMHVCACILLSTKWYTMPWHRVRYCGYSASLSLREKLMGFVKNISCGWVMWFFVRVFIAGDKRYLNDIRAIFWYFFSYVLCSCKNFITHQKAVVKFKTFYNFIY